MAAFAVRPLAGRISCWAARLGSAADRMQENARGLGVVCPPGASPLGRRMSEARLRGIMEMLRAGTGGPDESAGRVNIPGLARLRKILGEGRGAVVLWNHLGCCDLGLRALASLGIRSTAHADRPLGPLLWRGVVAHRAARGVSLLPRRSGLGPLLRALRRGELAAISWDGHLPDAPGETFRGIAAAVALAARAGCTLFRARCVENGAGHLLHLEGPVRIPAASSARTALSRDLEDAELRSIRRHADQWTLGVRFQFEPAGKESTAT